MHGFIGSGKTTLARRLETQLGALRFTPDEWITTLYGAEYPALLARVRILMHAQWTRAVTLGVPVILDEGLWTRVSRDELRAQAAALGVPLTLHVLPFDPATARERIAARNEEAGAHFVAPATFELFLPRFEPLTPDEEPLQHVIRS
nr:AAA family ATPase [Deinococcus sp. GbtcB9]